MIRWCRFIGKHSMPVQIQGGRKILALAIAIGVLPNRWSMRHRGIAQPSAGSQKFMALSLFATGRSKLDPELGAKLFACFA
jgi:hypothetical protein